MIEALKNQKGTRYVFGAFLFIFLFFYIRIGWTQQVDDNPSEEVRPEKEYIKQTGLWNGIYTKYRIGEKLFYYGEYHLRTRDNFVDNMAQIYLRFGLSYVLNKNLELTGGIVTPFYWAPKGEFGDMDPDEYDNVVNQFRFWQQALFIQPIGRSKFYHQIRTEQRWRRDYIINSPFELTYRFRYKLSVYTPLNNMELQEGTLFLSLYNEVFIQAGKPVTYNFLEDNRTFFGLGYILNENIQFQAGYMKTYQQRDIGYQFNNRDIFRFSIYHNLDFTQKRKQQQRIRDLGPDLMD